MSVRDPLWRAGVASVCITPDAPCWLAGYAHRTAPHKSVLSDIRVRAVALEDARGTRAVLLTADLVKVTPGMR